MKNPPRQPDITGVDLFCGAGGLTHGLQKAGISIAAGIDLDPACEYPFTANNGAAFIEADVRDISGADLEKLYPAGAVRLLAGCAPCRPFSSFRRGRRANSSRDGEWGLLGEFGRVVQELNPDLVTMENVPDLASQRPFHIFVSELRRLNYQIDFRSVYCPRLGIPQHRRRLVLIASLRGAVHVPTGSVQANRFATVRDVIDRLPSLSAGESDTDDPLHQARGLNDTNLRRLRASRPGGTWRDWPKELRAPCHRRATGATYQSVYARMEWDAPSPTITTQAYNFGTGRFGHPEQDRSITLREAALLQTFPRRYRFADPCKRFSAQTIGRLIGNAVPPRLAYFVGKEIRRAAVEPRRRKRSK